MAPNFRRGSAEAERAAESQNSGSFQRVRFASWTPQDPVKIVRFVNDFDGPNGWITCSQHGSVRTRPAPPNYSGQWPKAMPAVCRMDKDEDGNRVFPHFADCYACSHGVDDNTGKASVPKVRTWSLAIERVADFDASGRMTKISDKMVPYSKKLPNGEVETTMEPAWLLICQAWGTFWSSIDAVGKVHGTILDRDFRIVRKGFGQRDTDYQSAAYDPLVLADGKRFDLRDPEILAYYDQFGGIPDLGELIEERAGDEFFARFFDVRVPQPVYESDAKQQGGHAAAPAQQVAPPPTEVDQAALASMAARVANMGGGIATPYPTTQQAPADAVQQTTIAQPGFIQG